MYYAEPGATLEPAQQAKLELVCRKVDLRPGMRLLDAGCGWGSLALHAEAGLAAVVQNRLQDYRYVNDGRTMTSRVVTGSRCTQRGSGT